MPECSNSMRFGRFGSLRSGEASNPLGLSSARRCSSSKRTGISQNSPEICDESLIEFCIGRLYRLKGGAPNRGTFLPALARDRLRLGSRAQLGRRWLGQRRIAKSFSLLGLEPHLERFLLPVMSHKFREIRQVGLHFALVN